MTTSIDFIERLKCEMCGSLVHDILIRKHFTDDSVFDFIKNYYNKRVPENLLENKKFEVRKCKKCGFVWQGYVLNDDGMGELYNEWISEKESLAKKEKSGTGPHEEYVAEIKKFLKKPASEIKVLDFGMGWGFWCAAAQKQGFEVYGFEIAQTRMDYAKTAGINVINWDEISQNGPYDFINADQVFEHIVNPLETINFLTKNIKNNGIIKVVVPNGMSVSQDLANANWKASKNYIQPLEHINCFDFNSMIKLGKRAGISAIWPKNKKYLLKYFLSKYFSKVPLQFYYKK